MDKILYDIEVYKNYFCVGLKNYVTKEIRFYEVSDERDDRGEIFNFFKNFKGFLISFNGLHYDNVVVKYFLDVVEQNPYITKIDLCMRLKAFSDKIIKDEDLYFHEIKKYKYGKSAWTDIDLYTYWSKGLRIVKKISLKSLGIQMGYPVVQELPFTPDTVLTTEDLPTLRYYNYTHDLGILELLVDNMEEDIKLRDYVQKEYGLACWSMDAPKIASEYLLDYYCKETYQNDRPFYQYKKEMRKFRYEPKPWIVGDYLPKVNFKTKLFKDIYEEIRVSTNEKPYSNKFLFQQRSGEEVILSISQGGIHSVNDNQIFKEDSEHLLIDADIASLYPTLFDNYKFLRKDLRIVLDKYLNIRLDRIEAKRAGNKKKDTFLKLILNSFSGLVDSNVTWMYSPEHILALRITGQLIQLRFIEDLELEGISTIFTNTDGTLVKCPKDKVHVYHEIAENISKEFNVQWEYALLNSISFVNTNSYISDIYEEYMLDEDLNKINVKTGGKVKRKGSYFKYGKDIPLGDSVNELVIAKALEANLLKGVDVKEFIENPEKYDLHIFDYCKSDKISKDYTVWWDNQVQQQLNRYYFSKNKPFLLKKKFNKDTFDHVNVGKGVQLYNRHKDKPFEEYDINYTYYIARTNEIINKMKRFNQLTLF